MAHNLEFRNGKAQMFSVRQVPWHKLGKILDAPPTSEEAIREAGLDWDVELKPIYWKAPSNMGQETFHPFPNRCALVRNVDGNPLSIVSNNYKPLQNRKAFEWFDPIVQAGNATYETAGSLHDGKKIWILAKLGDGFEVVPGDEIRRYLLLANGHDGVTGIMIQPTPIRVVCENTLMQSLGSGLVNTIWHHGDIQEKMERVKKLLGLAEEEFESKRDVFRNMARFHIDKKVIGTYLKNLIPDANDEATESVQEKVDVARDRIQSLHETGFGSDIPGCKGTMWGLYNAAIEYGEYDMPKRVKDIGNYMLFGLGAQFKKRAYDKAVEIVES